MAGSRLRTALREPKSKLSRRISALEAQLGVHLIERSTRTFRVTDVGQSFCERCCAVMLEAQVDPYGRIRWRSKDGIVCLVFTTPRGLRPAVRALIDQMAGEFPKL